MLTSQPIRRKLYARSAPIFPPVHSLSVGLCRKLSTALAYRVALIW
jgi:hypothetical protein